MDEQKVDFAIITAVEIELKEVLRVFNLKDSNRIRKDSRVYWRGQLDIGDGESYEIVVAQTSDMANVDTALITSYTIMDWNPGSLLLVGIAGSANDEVELGDIVIGRDIYYYERGKVKPEGKLQEPITYRADATLFNNIRSISDSKIPKGKRPDGIISRPKVHYGAIASGEKVIADENFRNKIIEGHRKVLAIEMEGYGFSAAVWQSFEKRRHLVIRAICDRADRKKNDNWQPYAAKIASTFAKNFLLDRPITPTVINKSSTTGKKTNSRPQIRGTVKNEIKNIKTNGFKDKQKLADLRLIESTTNTAQVTILLNRDIHEFTPSEQTSLVFALSRIVNVNPDQIRILRVVPGSVLVLLEMPEESAKTLLSLSLQQTAALRALHVKRVELIRDFFLELEQSELFIVVLNWLRELYQDAKFNNFRGTIRKSHLETPENIRNPAPQLIRELKMLTEATDARKGEKFRVAITNAARAILAYVFSLPKPKNLTPDDTQAKIFGKKLQSLAIKEIVTRYIEGFIGEVVRMIIGSSDPNSESSFTQAALNLTERSATKIANKIISKIIKAGKLNDNTEIRQLIADELRIVVGGGAVGIEIRLRTIRQIVKV